MIDLQVLIKYFALIWCSIYTFSKLINKPIKHNKTYIWLPITIFASIISYIFRLIIPPLNLITIYITIVSFVLSIYKKTINITVAIAIISFGASFIFYIASWIICIPISYFLFSLIKNMFFLDAMAAIFISIIQFICVHLFFKIKRFKNGLVSFENIFDNELSVFISIFILLFISLFYKTDDVTYLDTLVLTITTVISLLLLFYWKKHTTNTYLHKIHKRNITILNDEIAELKHSNIVLEKQNEELSKIIHRDNKLIPAMEMAIEEILNCQSPDE